MRKNNAVVFCPDCNRDTPHVNGICAHNEETIISCEGDCHLPPDEKTTEPKEEEWEKEFKEELKDFFDDHSCSQNIIYFVKYIIEKEKKASREEALGEVDKIIESHKQSNGKGEDFISIWTLKSKIDELRNPPTL